MMSSNLLSEHCEANISILLELTRNDSLTQIHLFFLYINNKHPFPLSSSCDGTTVSNRLVYNGKRSVQYPSEKKCTRCFTRHEKIRSVQCTRWFQILHFVFKQDFLSIYLENMRFLNHILGLHLHNCFPMRKRMKLSI